MVGKAKSHRKRSSSSSPGGSKSTAKRKTVAAKASRKKSTAKAKTKKATKKRTTPAKRWSQRVTEHSDALDLKQGVFKLHDPKQIAASLKRSAERSTRRKSGAYRSALSMLTFYINRAGKTLSKTQRKRLEDAKVELRHSFHRDA